MPLYMIKRKYLSKPYPLPLHTNTHSHENAHINSNHTRNICVCHKKVRILQTKTKCLQAFECCKPQIGQSKPVMSLKRHLGQNLLVEGLATEKITIIKTIESKIAVVFLFRARDILSNS